MSIAQKIASGLNPSSTLAKSADYTILSTDAKIFLVTTAGSDRTMTLPAASSVAGEIIRFTKIDTGTGKLIIARAGSDTMGINGTTSMELWYKDNYVDIMSDGTSRWIVMNTGLFLIPESSRNASMLLSSSSTLNAWTDLDCSSHVPVGTCEVELNSMLQSTSQDTATQYLIRPNGSSETDPQKVRYGSLKADASDVDHRVSDNFRTEISADRIIEYFINNTAGSLLSLTVRGYKLG